MANRNGLNHKVRGFKGVGFNRALPAAFGFGNGIFPDGVNDYLTIPKLTGKLIPNRLTIEYWTKCPNPTKDLGCVMRMHSLGGNALIVSRINAPLTVISSVANEGSGLGYTLASDTRTGVIAYSLDLVDGIVNFFTPNSPPLTVIRNNLKLHNGKTFERVELFSSGDYTSGNGNAAMDEFRIYKKIITTEQFSLDYNAGIGNNPFETESLLVWYKFEAFEFLDFSELQDGSDIRFGMRDFSGNNYHGQPFFMDTNPSSSNYVLKAF